ncbi:uncharacterized protein AKAME5_001173400 [Lates japonicus]|uniref:Uncharacterized protein n=1 Tax=Lates japonicus TaxID=270547 RepID=A0AAD3MR02_LATJO|nr:uncharacterized protein AKAME5_001173400 [Lates japonicus]
MTMPLSNLRDKTAECEDAQKEQRSRVQIITSAVRTLLHQVNICRDGRDSSTLINLVDFFSEDKVSSFSQLLTWSLSPLWSNSVSPAEQVRLFCDAAMKHLLWLLFHPPLSWGMGMVLEVQSSKSSTATLAESAQL